MKISALKISGSIVSALILIVVAQACTESKGNASLIPKTTDPIPVRVMNIEKSSVEPVIAASGKITTDDETILAFKVGGIVKSVFVKDGDKITKGQTLAILDLTEVSALVSQARYGFEKAERDLKRAQNLYKDSVATLEQLQNAQTAFELAESQLKAANFNLSFSEIKAPSSGYVLKKFINAGQVVGIGDPILKTNGAGGGNWVLKAGVSDKQWASIKINDKASVDVDAFPDQKFEGHVVRKSESPEAGSGSFTVDIAIKRSEQRLATGMFAKASISSGNSVSSWSIPYEAVLDASGNDGFVFITNDDKMAVKVPVTIVSFDRKSIQIGQGLEGAKSLIVSGSAYLADRSPIVIIK